LNLGGRARCLACGARAPNASPTVSGRREGPPAPHPLGALHREILQAAIAGPASDQSILVSDGLNVDEAEVKAGARRFAGVEPVQTVMELVAQSLLRRVDDTRFELTTKGRRVAGDDEA
jgi:hypothetical protein